MLILILMDVQYSWKAVFSFEKDSNHQNHSSLDSLQPVKNPPVKFLIPHHTLYCYLENPGLKTLPHWS